jgi:hypothetical protein
MKSLFESASIRPIREHPRPILRFLHLAAFPHHVEKSATPKSAKKKQLADMAHMATLAD